MEREGSNAVDQLLVKLGGYMILLDVIGNRQGFVLGSLIVHNAINGFERPTPIQDDVGHIVFLGDVVNHLNVGKLFCLQYIRRQIEHAVQFVVNDRLNSTEFAEFRIVDIELVRHCCNLLSCL